MYFCYSAQMQILLYYVLVFTLTISLNAKAENAYIDNIEDDDQKISVYKDPGQNWQHCAPGKKKCEPAIGWLDRDSKIEILSKSEKYQTVDLDTESLSFESYTKIKFKYMRKVSDLKNIQQSGEGYIPSTYISKKKVTAFFSTSESLMAPKKPICNTNNTNERQFSQIDKTITPLVKSIDHLSVNLQADLIGQAVGFCPLKPPNKFVLPKLNNNKNIYDELVKEQIDSAFTEKNIPKILNEKNQLMTKNQLIEIDALSRTLYGEMATCYKSGLQYPMAVAKVIMNRSAETKRHKEFIKPPHDTTTPNLAKICTSPSQFSMWFKNIDGSKNNPLHHGLCPPKQINKPFWRSLQANKSENDIWKNSVRIATEAVLHPTKFKKRTAEVDGFFYTSNIGEFYGMKQQKNLTIEGHLIDNNKCLEIWKE